MNKGCFKKGHKTWNKGKTYKTGIKRTDIKVGKESPLWKGGFSHTAQGYITIRIGVGPGTQQLYHRYVMEQHLGRKLNYKEHVHHGNGDKTDNRLENLELMSDSTHNGLDIKKHPEKHHFFKKGDPPPPHKTDCKCFRCSPYTAKMWERVKR